MKNGLSAILVAFVSCMLPTAAQAQCNGQFAAGTICGNPTGAQALPRSVPFANFLTVTPAILGTSLYPVYNATGKSYDLTSALLVNTIGAKWGVFGSASKDQPSWLETYASGVSFFNVGASVIGISPNGIAGGLFAARSSDNSNPSSTTIPLNCFALADNASANVPTWCQYSQSTLLASAIQNQHIGHESSIQNFWTAVDETPYNVNPAGGVRNFRADCGIGPTASMQTKCSTAIDVVYNGQTYRSGIVFDATALDIAAGRIAPALSLATNHSLTWYSTAGVGWSIFSNVTTNPNNTILLGSNVAEFSTVVTVFGQLQIKGSTSGQLILAAPAAAGANTLTFPAGTTNFTATGGTSQVLKQTSSGGALTVARLACADLSDATGLCSATVGLSVTKTVRASGGSVDCTLIYTGGILTGGSC